MSDITKTLGARIRNYRKQANLTQEELAELACVHSTYIGQLERGEKNATVDTIVKISRALHIPPETLFSKIIVLDNQNSISAECYELINSLPEKEQEQMLSIITTIVDMRA
ncbi:MAG: helix-turn-helix domain-containing protein [Lachnospiraceae bacterium]